MLKKAISYLRYMKAFHLKSHGVIPASDSSRDNSACRQLRAQLALISPISLPDGASFVFLNRFTYYDTILNLQGHLATVDELEKISDYMNINGCYLCPLTVWASKEGLPVLVKLKPGYRKSVRILHTPSSYYLAFAIFLIPNQAQNSKDLE